MRRWPRGEHSATCTHTENRHSRRALLCSALLHPLFSLLRLCSARAAAARPPRSLLSPTTRDTHILTRMPCWFFLTGGSDDDDGIALPAAWLAPPLQPRGHARPGPPEDTQRTRQPGGHPEEARRGAARGGGAPGGDRGQDSAAGKRPRRDVELDVVPRCASCATDCFARPLGFVFRPFSLLLPSPLYCCCESVRMC
eukprot:COSAG06_NODE_5929_length_3204_cov_6.035427_5_plen_197_part_00